MKRVMTAPSRLFMVSAATASITSCGERAMPVAKGGPLGIALAVGLREGSHRSGEPLPERINQMPDAVRATVFREGASHVDVKMPSSGWFGEVRAWRGQRWPDLEKVWYGRLKPWIPWFSLERQVLRAIEHGR
jgi:hypothetical protein